MIFTTKSKSEPEEKNWCVVLKSFSNTLDRTRLIQKLQKAFEVSGEDALDVMQNTPIILLDHLPREQANKVKEYFSDNGVEVALTNDNFYKRRCYRTVWPTVPNIESILQPGVIQPVQERNQGVEAVMTAESTPKISKQFLPPESISPPDKNQAWNTSQREFLEQKEMLVRDSLKLQEEVARLRSMTDRSLQQIAEKERALQLLTAEKKDREMEAQRLEVQLAATEEKFKIAREEFRDTRAYFEERLLAQESKMRDLQTQSEEMSRILREAQDARNDLEKNLSHERAQLETARGQVASAQIEWETRTANLRHEAELQKRMLQEYESKLSYIESSRKLAEDSELRGRQELEKQALATRSQELRAHQLEKELERLQSVYDSHEKSWTSRLHEVEMREKELESARRQIRDLQHQMERRELIQRKVFIAEQIASKELRLKSLVKKQEQLENEARERENDLKKLFEEQEAVEKGLIEDRQAQKHLLEKIKSETEGGEASESSQGHLAASEESQRPA